MKKIVVILLLLFSQLSCMNQFEKGNNNLLAETLNILDIPDKKVALKRIEQKYLYNIEQDVKQQVASLPCNLKKLLGDFDIKFKQFKDKLAFLKKNENLLVDNDLDLTILGLKPVSILEDISAEYMEPIKKLINLVMSTYKSEYISGVIKDEILIDENGSEIKSIEYPTYILCHTPIFPLAFIKECYRDSQESKNFFKEFNSILLSQNEIEIRKFLETHWIAQVKDENFKAFSDELAYILGYTPIWFWKKILEKKTMTRISYAKDIDPSMFRTLLITGTIDPEDRSPYLLLLAKLYEYGTIILSGLNGYLDYLEYNLRLDIPEEQYIALYKSNDKFFYISQIISKLAEPKKIQKNR